MGERHEFTIEVIEGRPASVAGSGAADLPVPAEERSGVTAVSG